MRCTDPSCVNMIHIRLPIEVMLFAEIAHALPEGTELRTGEDQLFHHDTDLEFHVPHDWEESKSVAVIDEEAAGMGSTEAVVARFRTVAQADEYIEHLPDQEKVARGGYGIDAPDVLTSGDLTTARSRVEEMRAILREHQEHHRQDQLVFDDREPGPERDLEPSDVEEGPQ